MIFRHDCGQCASVTGRQPLSFRLHSGHFATVAMCPLLGTQVRLVGWMLAGSWLEPAERGTTEETGFYSPMTRAATVAAASSERAGMAWE